MIRGESIRDALRWVGRTVVVPTAERCIAAVATWAGSPRPASPPHQASPPQGERIADPGDDAGLTERQRDIARSLAKHNPELGRWFTSAAALTHDQRPSAWPELVAHLGRDLMNRLPEYFDVPRPPRIEYPQLVGKLVKALGTELSAGGDVLLSGKALEALRTLVAAQAANTARPGPGVLFAAAGRPPSPLETHRIALNDAWTQTQRAFVAAVHMRSVGKDPVPASEVLVLFNRFEDLLAAQLGAVSFWSLEAELREIAGLTEPTRSDLDRALLLARGEAINTFLGSLSSPAWLAPMTAAGLFESPTPTEVLTDRGYRTPFWEPSRFLVRIASQAPDEVTQTLLSLPSTDNARVHRDIIDAALAMPAQHAARIASVVPAILPGPYPMFAAEPAAQLAARLVNEGHVDAGAELARFLFTSETVVTADWGLGVDVNFRHVFDSDYSFAEAVSGVQAAFADHAPLAGLGLFVDVLASTLDNEQRARGREGPEELSYVWRKAIDDHAQNVHDGEVRDALIVAIRDLAAAITQRQPDSATRVLATLSSREHLIFRRLALHLIRVGDFPEAIELRRAAMLDREGFDDRRIHREMFLLQLERFGELGADDQAQITSWIEAGPDDEQRWREAFERFEGRPANDADLATHRAGWQQRHWLALEPWLSPQHKAQLDALNEKYGVDKHPEFSTFVTVGFSPIEMPYASEDLTAMSVGELLALFASWQPAGDGLAARPDALGMAVEQAVRDSPDHWADRARDLAAAPPRYRQHLFSGFASAAALEKPYDLGGVLDLAAAHLDDGPPQVGDDDARRSGRRAVGDLLRWLLDTPTSVAGFEDRIWELLRRLAEDEEPKDYDATTGVPQWSPDDRQLPLDTVASLAFHAVIAYARRLTPAGPRHQEIHELIEAGLDPNRRRLAVYAKIASRLPELVELDSEWAKTLLGPMLADESEPIVEVSWSAVLDHKPIALPVVRALLEAGSYEWALDHIAGEARFSQERRERLGRHLVGAAVFDLEGYGTPWSRWHEIEDGAIRARVIEAVGHELGLRLETLPAESIASRWSERLDALPDGDPELAGYGSWFGAGLLAPGMGAELLVRTLRASRGALSNVRAVLDAMTSAAAVAPLVVIEALRLIADGPVAGQLAWHDRDVRNVIGVLADIDESAVAEGLQQLIDALAERGLGDFRPGER